MSNEMHNQEISQTPVVITNSLGQEFSLKKDAREEFNEKLNESLTDEEDDDEVYYDSQEELDDEDEEEVYYDASEEVPTSVSIENRNIFSDIYNALFYPELFQYGYVTKIDDRETLKNFCDSIDQLHLEMQQKMKDLLQTFRELTLLKKKVERLNKEISTKYTKHNNYQTSGRSERNRVKRDISNPFNITNRRLRSLETMHNNLVSSMYANAMDHDRAINRAREYIKQNPNAFFVKCLYYVNVVFNTINKYFCKPILNLCLYICKPILNLCLYIFSQIVSFIDGCMFMTVYCSFKIVSFSFGTMDWIINTGDRLMEFFFSV